MSGIGAAILVSTSIVSGVYAGGSSETTTNFYSMEGCWAAINAISDTATGNNTKTKVFRTSQGTVLEYGFENKDIRRELSCVKGK